MNTVLKIAESTELETKDGLNPGQVAVITQRTPAQLILQRKGRGGALFSYVPHNYVTELLNQAFSHAWSFETEVLNDFCNAEEVTVKGRLVVHGQDGRQIVKEQFGSQEILKDKSGKPAMSFGDALKGAGSDSLRKCASLLGIALDLYGAQLPQRAGKNSFGNWSQEPKQAQGPEKMTEETWAGILSIIQNPVFNDQERKKAHVFCAADQTEKKALRFLKSLKKHNQERQEKAEKAELVECEDMSHLSSDKISELMREGKIICQRCTMLYNGHGEKSPHKAASGSQTPAQLDAQDAGWVLQNEGPQMICFCRDCAGHERTLEKIFEYYDFKGEDIQALINYALDESGMQDGPEFRQVLINDFSVYLEAYRKIA